MITYGSGGGASVNAAYSKASVDYAQVKEQTGIQVGEEGMNATIHNHTQLNGAIIDSQAETNKNRFKTGSISHADIENRSEIKTESASISAGSGGINPMQALSSALSLLGNSHESERSQTKSAISENIRIDTKTPEKLTALSRDTKNANQQVNKQDLKKVQERQEMAKEIGEIANNAISIATYEEREKINKLGLEKFKLEEQYGKNHPQALQLGEQINQIQENIDRTYGIGSPNGMAIRAVTAALQAAAQNDTNGTIVALASPYLNQKIHEMTDSDTAKDKAANLAAHALLSAVEFQVTGKDPLTGAVAGVTGEATATILTKALYDKTPDQLTASEKENISTLSQIAGGLAGELTAKTNGTSKENGGGMALAVAGAETAKRAVENNTFFIGSTDQEYVKSLQVKAKADEVTKYLEEQATEDAIKEIKENPGEAIKAIANELAPHYVAGGVAIYKYSAKFSINLRTFDVFVGGGVSQAPIISSGGVSANLEAGWIINFDQGEKKNLGYSINNVLGGGATGATACTSVGYCGSVSVTMPTKQMPKPYISTGAGIGGGYSISTDVMFRVTGGK